MKSSHTYPFILSLLFTLTLITSQACAASVEDKALKSCIEKAKSKAKVSSPEQLKSLKCHNKGIRSIVGLEQYTHLESLSLFGNKIISADLRALTKLETLNLAKNDLEDLNLQGLSNLKALFIFKNKLSTIELAGLDNLVKVRAMQNKLQVLDITPLKSLEEAYFWDNELEDLQITGLNNLKFLDVKQNPMPDELYDFYDEQSGITISHDGNADDWK